MNCQDISRIADHGRFGDLSAAERSAAESHALTCRRCAPVWAAHARLAELRIPAMPIELSMRCRTLAAAPIHPRGTAARKRLVIVGTVAALAAAAGILMMQWRKEPALDLPAPGAAHVLDAAPSGQPESPALASADDSPTPEMKASASEAGLALIAPPVELDLREAEDLALQKLVERHPELVTGPEMDMRSSFMAAMGMRVDGDVVSSDVRTITPGVDAYAIDQELALALPKDAGSFTIAQRKRHTMLPGGHSLRADLSFKIQVFPANYNGSQSSTRIQQILGNKYDSLLLPSRSDNGVLNRLTILLAEDGSILREQVESERDDPAFSDARGYDPGDVARYAQGIASKLGTSVEQIGLMGSTSLQRGPINLVWDGTPGGRMVDNRRQLLVRYAWVRGKGESGPRLGQGGTTPPIDNALALAILEQQVPDAFTVKGPPSERIVVVLGEKGEFIKARRVQMNGTIAMIADRLVPGIKTGPTLNSRVKNKAGETVYVQFAWKAPEKEAARP